MRSEDAERLFAAADPAGDLDLRASLESVWGRIDPPQRAPVQRRNRSIRAVLVAGVAAVIAAAMALLPATDRRDGAPAIPAPVQAFADELSGDGVLHVVTERAGAVDQLGRLTPLPPQRTEGWYALDGSAWRTRLSGARRGYFEEVYDGQAIRVFNSGCGLVNTFPPPPAAAFGSTQPLQVGIQLLDFHRELSAGDARVLGRATVRGVPAFEIRYDLVPGDPGRLLYVSADRSRLLRVEELSPPIRYRSEVPTYEVLPPSGRSAQLLLPSPQFREFPQPTCE
jgi:hypothetical protein